MEHFQKDVPGGFLCSRPAGKFEGEDGRVVEFNDALDFTFRKKRIVIEIDALQELADHICNDTEFQKAFLK